MLDLIICFISVLVLSVLFVAVVVRVECSHSVIIEQMSATARTGPSQPNCKINYSECSSRNQVRFSVCMVGVVCLTDFK
jgi:hypothetical protein